MLLGHLLCPRRIPLLCSDAIDLVAAILRIGAVASEAGCWWRAWSCLTSFALEKPRLVASTSKPIRANHRAERLASSSAMSSLSWVVECGSREYSPAPG